MQLEQGMLRWYGNDDSCMNIATAIGMAGSTFGVEQVVPTRVVTEKGNLHSVDRLRLLKRVSRKLPRLPRRRLPLDDE